jgi:hypothetical protein
MFACAHILHTHAAILGIHTEIHIILVTAKSCKVAEKRPKRKFIACSCKFHKSTALQIEVSIAYNTICRILARHGERTHAALYVVDIHNPRQDTSMFMIQSPLASTKFT